jgi:predicted anti-sigma-YlaC factor YlaD
MSAREGPHLTDEQLDDYADGVMPDAARALAEEHLLACDRCRRALGDTREVIALAQRERVALSAPAELWPLVASSTIHLAAMRRQVLASLRGVLIAGAIALVAATAVVTWKVARWTTARDVPAPTIPARTGGLGPGRHAGHPSGGHPVAPQPPAAPVAPRAR